MTWSGCTVGRPSETGHQLHHRILLCISMDKDTHINIHNGAQTLGIIKHALPC